MRSRFQFIVSWTLTIRLAGTTTVWPKSMPPPKAFQKSRPTVVPIRATNAHGGGGTYMSAHSCPRH